MKALQNLRDSRWLTRKGWAQALLAGTHQDELAQAKLRVGIGSLVVLVLLAIIIAKENPSPELVHSFWFVTGFVLFGIFLAVRIHAHRGVSPVFRFLGTIADNAGTTYFMWLMDEGGAIVFFIYLWVAFGNSLRFGRLYLHASQGLALLGFTFVLFFSDFWADHKLMGLGIILSLLLLPVYVGILKAKIDKEKNRAEEANQSKDRFLANVSHEMRTPLNGVIAMADLLR